MNHEKVARKVNFILAEGILMDLKNKFFTSSGSFWLCHSVHHTFLSLNTVSPRPEITDDLSVKFSTELSIKAPRRAVRRSFDDDFIALF